MNLLGPLLILAGAISIGGAVFNWEWFFHNSKTRMVVTLLGQTGARIFYGIFGIGIFVLGVFLSLGFFSNIK